METNLLTLYLRREPFSARAKQFDVAAYSSLDDAKAHKQKARWLWYQKSKPTRRNKRVTLNCYQWTAVWLPEET